MICDSKKKLFDVVLIWKLDRFSRNRLDAVYYKKNLKDNGVKVVSVTEPIPEGAMGTLVEAMLEAWAEGYVENLSENIVRGLTENALKSVYNGSVLPVGYKVDEQRRYQIDEPVAPYVIDAFGMYADGKKMQEIADYLNWKGVRTMNGGTITVNTVSRMLRNRRYLGEYRYDKIVNPGMIPRIVSDELFERVQARIERTRKAPAQHKAEDDYIKSKAKRPKSRCERWSRMSCTSRKASCSTPPTSTPSSQKLRTNDSAVRSDARYENNLEMSYEHDYSIGH